MKAAIVAVEMPRDPSRQVWPSFLAAIHKIANDPGVTALAENVWQIDFHKSPAALAILVKGAADLQLVYKILPFDAEPQWLPVGPSPAPNQG